MRYIFYIAIKYFAALRKQNLVNLITLISMSGVMFGTMAMIVVLSVFNGFDQLVQNLFKNKKLCLTYKRILNGLNQPFDPLEL